MADGLTEKQAMVLNYIEATFDEFGHSPTGTEIAEAFEITLGSASTHIMALVRKGFLRYGTRGTTRDLQSTRQRIKQPLTRIA